MANILIVDDETAITQTTKMMLENEGHKVAAAFNGKECFEYLEKTKPDLILLDVMMPGLNGWQVSKKIKENIETKEIPVVIFTVYSPEESEKKSKKYADALVNKPFKKEKLLKVISELVKE